MNYLPPVVDHRDRATIQRASALLRSEFSDGLTRTDLRRINNDQGVDFATALLYSHFMSKLHDDWFQAGTMAASKMTASTVESPPNTPPPTIAIVPGAFYKEYPHIGADGREFTTMAASRDWNCELIPTASLGTLDENAAAITRWFDAQKGADFVLLSLSKGAADVKIALEKRPDLWDRIRAWVCVSGILYGTRITNWLLESKRLWLTMKYILWYWNLQKESFVELRHDVDIRGRCVSAGQSRDKTLTRLGFQCTRIDQHNFRQAPFVSEPIQIVGFPLIKHLSCFRSKMWHRRFRNLGPNDGVMMLEDLLEQPGAVAPIWGADHYLKNSLETFNMLAHIIDLVATQNSTATHSPKKGDGVKI